MAQVNYWLGKQVEGKKILDAILAAPATDFELKLLVANVMRDLGLEAESKTLLEKLYQTAKTPLDKGNAAHGRALLCNDVDEEIVWLERSTDSPERRASLSRARGTKLLIEGDQRKAEVELRKAAEAYAAMPQHASSLNNGAICYYSLFQVSGKRSDLDEATTRFGKAVALEPDDSILVVNTGRVTCKRAIAGIVEPQVDLRLLNVGDDLDLLPFLYRDEAGFRQMADRLRASQELKQATRHFERGALLAPKRAEIYDWFVSLHDYLDDKESLKRLQQRIIEAQPETSERLREGLELIRGARDKETLKGLADSQKLHRNLRDEIAALPPGEKRNISLAIVNHQIVEAMIGELGFSQPVKMDEAVKLAEESVAQASSSATDAMLAAVLAARAHQNLAKKHPEYRRHADACRRVFSPSVAVYLALDDPLLRKLVLADADFRRSAELNFAHCERFPSNPGAWNWMECRFTHPQQAEALRPAARQNEQERLTAEILQRLNPADVHQAAFRAAICRCDGHDDQAQQVWQQIRALGIPVPGTVLGKVAGN
jgi:tetratricopeptide (TPR) repeat protein